MKTVTFGSGGQYATLKDCYSGVTFDDHVTAVQISSTTEGSSFNIRDQFGFSFTVKGNKAYTLTANTGNAGLINRGITPNGDFLIRGINAICNVPLFSNSGYVGLGSKLTISHCKLTVNHADGVIGGNGSNYTGGFLRSDIHNNLIVVNNGAFVFGIYAGKYYFLEDNLLISTGSNSKLCETTHASGAASYATYLRNYSVNMPFAFAANVSYVSQTGVTENFANDAPSWLLAERKNIAFSTANFQSIDPLSVLYAVPKTAAMSTGASQATNIPDNAVGYNGVSSTAVSRSAGCMSMPVMIPNPTVSKPTAKQSGVEVVWVNAPITGYGKTYLYWEQDGNDSSFKVPKAVVDFAVQSYVIPYAQLAGAETWYLKVVHGV